MINLKLIKDAGFSGKAAPADAGPPGPSRGKGKGGIKGGGKKSSSVITVAEQAFLDLSPDALYNFTNNWESSGVVTDLTGNGYDLAFSGFTVAAQTRGAAIRTDHPGALVLPEYAGGSNTAAVCCGNEALGNLMASATDSCLVVGYKWVSTYDASPGQIRLAGTHSNSTTIGSTADSFTLVMNSGMTLRQRHGSGSVTLTSTTAATETDGASIAAGYFQWTDDNFIMHAAAGDVAVQSDAGSTTNYNRSASLYSFRVGDTTTSEHGYTVLIDFVAVWQDTVVAKASIDAAMLLYVAEMA